jgi:hypothetical protein
MQEDLAELEQKAIEIADANNFDCAVEVTPFTHDTDITNAEEEPME